MTGEVLPRRPTPARPARPALRRVYADEAHQVAWFGNFQLSFSHAEPSGPYLGRAKELIDQLLRRHPSGIGLVIVIGESAAAPSEESRAHIRNALLDCRHGIGGVVQVVLGSGFGAAAKRSALSLIHLSNRYAFPLKVFGSVDDAAPWLVERFPEESLGGVTARSLASAAAELSARAERR